jgi:hypothetical protein
MVLTHPPHSIAGSLLLSQDIPYPSPADRKELENAVKTNWDLKVQKPLGQLSDHSGGRWEHTKEWIFDT